jgi:hypothetical protein
MNSRAATIVLWCVGAILTAGAVWLWFDKMEQRWEAQPYRSPEAEKNHMLAAERWLTQHQRKVQSLTNLAQLPLATMPNGLLLIAENDGIVTAEQSTTMLRWVQRGNTLVMRPPQTKERTAYQCGEPPVLPQPSDTSDRQQNPAQEVNWNPISTNLGVWVVQRSAQGKADDDTNEPTSPNDGVSPPPSKPRAKNKNSKAKSADIPCLTHWVAPSGNYPLLLDVSRAALVSKPTEKHPLYSDDSGEGVRIYPEGKGHIALIADHYFSVGTNSYGMPHALVRSVQPLHYWHCFGSACAALAPFCQTPAPNADPSWSISTPVAAGYGKRSKGLSNCSMLHVRLLSPYCRAKCPNTSA